MGNAHTTHGDQNNMKPERSMKVSHFSTFPYGGAAAAALRTHRQLRKQNVDSRFYYHRNDRDDVREDAEEKIQKIDLVPPKQGILRRFVNGKKTKKRNKEIYRLHNQHLANRNAHSETFSMARLPEVSRLSLDSVDVDVVHLHWLAFFADYESFFESIPRHVPIVWTLHDMNAFTGGCHYSGGCQRFRSGCGGCPQITNPSPQDVSADSFEAKRLAMAGRRIHVTAPSQWMIDLAQQSSVWPEETTFEKIHLGFDLSQFYPVDKSEARRQLGIESDAVLIGFGADDLKSHRKGFHHLLNSLRKIQSKSPIEGLVFGAGEIPPSEDLPKFHSQGFVDSVDRQRLIYSAADLVIVPSREDNQPQVGLEAMACRTPVVGFDAGGIPEYVRQGETGCLVPLGDEGRLAESISGLVDLQSLRQRLGDSALAMVAAEFELEKQTQSYQRTYENLCYSSVHRNAA
jgi:glycosyltransferase involved in cell wall biosynthesis